ncbi:acyltransferase [Mucilaginibacter sp. PAMC 26640]|nr:acyltransferase [Mucilaginibacter sp. PAMC 26640]
MTQTDTAQLKSKQHFDILDGLRGVAALAVVTFHFMEVVYTPDRNFIGHGFLAVDFFFCLSGFVIGYAYDDRIGKIGILEFLKSRLIRLHPLVVLGSVLGLLSFLFDPFGNQAAAYSAGKLAVFFITSVLLIPYPQMPERYFNLFNLNAPAWSLFWEYVANVVYALLIWRVNRNLLLVLTMLSAIAVFFVAYRAGSILGGWDGKSFWDGCARICYSFLAGLFVYRSNWIIKNKIGFIGLAILLFLTFVMPFSRFNWLTEPIVVVLYFPLLISLGAGAVLSPGLKKLCVFAGNISYPLYMTHYAVIWAFANYYAIYKPLPGQLAIIIGVSLVLLVALAWLVMVLFDMPIRKYLTDRRKQALK